MRIGERCVVVHHPRINPDFVGAEVIIMSVARDYCRAQVVKRVGKLASDDYFFVQNNNFSFVTGCLRPVSGFKQWAQTKGR